MKIFPVNTWRQRWLLLAVCWFGAAAAGYVLAADGGEEAEATVLTVNGEAVTVQEFEAAMSRERLATIRLFQSRYGAEYRQGFWQKEYGGQTPRDALRQKALEQITQLKVQQIAAKKAGLVKDITYGGFLKAREEENRRRQEDAGGGKVVYGPLKYGVEEYYQYTINNLLIRLQEWLSARELSPSPEAIAMFYQKNKDTLYKKSPSIQTKKLFVPDETEASRQIAQQAIEQAEHYHSLDLAAASMDAKVQLSEQVFDDESLRDDARYMPELLEAAQQLAPGKISGIIPVSAGYAVLQCLKREEGGYVSLEQVEEDIRSRLLEVDYEAWLKAEIRQAKVEIHQDVFDKLEVQD
ncbi:hypothetical protein J23TS9_52580 [Paenibacillus sp. J23TS9]|uniref:peptidylprolyl isomerase n=1 Tax=Paenibacillus sp. J23TS9 TaxID=2807193 RepID=UPI001B04F58A|nr:peptidyl-prolyl cis-trans isomerase [Paenibacillus sp. J23TS9]GIP30128.1 hypothetical protein J23TS9_52580 [Paenibacillus sp. J23TS9]